MHDGRDSRSRTDILQESKSRPFQPLSQDVPGPASGEIPALVNLAEGEAFSAFVAACVALAGRWSGIIGSLIFISECDRSDFGDKRSPGPESDSVAGEFSPDRWAPQGPQEKPFVHGAIPRPR